MDCETIDDPSGLSAGNEDLVKNTIKNLISVKKYRALFSMADLHGFTASKTSMYTNYIRASQPTMAAMGSLINDLPDLEGKSGIEIIESCMAWDELRLSQGVRLITDNWHKRFYWSNSGGSHHMAVLCYELKRQDRNWLEEVEILEYAMNIASLACLKNRVSIFVAMHDEYQYGYRSIFEDKEEIWQNETIRKELGVSFLLPAYYPAILGNYILILIDHSKAYSEIVFDQLKHLANNQQKIMWFDDFLKAWVSRDSSNQPLKKWMNKSDYSHF